MPSCDWNSLSARHQKWCVGMPAERHRKRESEREREREIERERDNFAETYAAISSPFRADCDRSRRNVCRMLLAKQMRSSVETAHVLKPRKHL